MDPQLILLYVVFIGIPLLIFCFPIQTANILFSKIIANVYKLREEELVHIEHITRKFSDHVQLLTYPYQIDQIVLGSPKLKMDETFMDEHNTNFTDVLIFKHNNIPFTFICNKKTLFERKTFNNTLIIPKTIKLIEDFPLTYYDHIGKFIFKFDITPYKEQILDNLEDITEPNFNTRYTSFNIYTSSFKHKSGEKYLIDYQFIIDKYNYGTNKAIKLKNEMSIDKVIEHISTGYFMYSSENPNKLTINNCIINYIEQASNS